MKIQINKYYIIQTGQKVLVAGDGLNASPPFRGFYGILYYEDPKFPRVTLRKKLKWDMQGKNKNPTFSIVGEWRPLA